ncbi:MAG: uS17 family ribosomal protein [Patescibacteria group bacterium]
MKTINGTIISVGMQKTVVVGYTITRPHPLYRKVLRMRHRVKAHTDIPLSIGDNVTIKATRPISKEKHYQVVKKT